MIVREGYLNRLRCDEVKGKKASTGLLKRQAVLGPDVAPHSDRSYSRDTKGRCSIRPCVLQKRGTIHRVRGCKDNGPSTSGKLPFSMDSDLKLEVPYVYLAEPLIRNLTFTPIWRMRSSSQQPETLQRSLYDMQRILRTGSFDFSLNVRTQRHAPSDIPPTFLVPTLTYFVPVLERNFHESRPLAVIAYSIYSG